MPYTFPGAKEAVCNVTQEKWFSGRFVANLWMNKDKLAASEYEAFGSCYKKLLHSPQPSRTDHLKLSHPDNCW